MIKLKKELNEIKERLLRLENCLKSLEIQNPPAESSNTPSYKEVIDEWINGKVH